MLVPKPKEAAVDVGLAPNMLPPEPNPRLAVVVAPKPPGLAPNKLVWKYWRFELLKQFIESSRHKTIFQQHSLNRKTE